MKNSLFQKIVKDSQRKIQLLAKKNGLLWFYNMHQKEVVRNTEKLLNLYKKADRKIAMIACWLHDISKYYSKNRREISRVDELHHTVERFHHIDSANLAERFLKNYNLTREEIDKIKNCILRHRNSKPYKAKTLEEKIIAVADTLSHLTSIFYLTYFKFFPDNSLEKMVKSQLEKLDRDWRDLQLLPKAKKLVEKEYKTLKKLLANYKG